MAEIAKKTGWRHLWTTPSNLQAWLSYHQTPEDNDSHNKKPKSFINPLIDYKIKKKHVDHKTAWRNLWTTPSNLKA
jgi:hypothetical protein